MGNYGTIRVSPFIDAHKFPNIQWDSEDHSSEIVYTKYNIKETDFRVKTASFTTPQYLDLTKGRFAVLIKSDYHENFAGQILDVEYDESNALYTYQCQDWSRNWISNVVGVYTKKPQIRILKSLVTKGALPVLRKPTKAETETYKDVLKGIKATGLYDQSLYEGNVYKGNPMKQNRSLYLKDKPFIEVIRDIVYSSLGYFDVHFTDSGVLCIDPISKTDWESTGLHLVEDTFYNRKFKFSTTNAITGVQVNPKSDLTGTTAMDSQSLIGLDLAAFFGKFITSINNPNDTSNAVKNTSTTSKKTTTTSKKSTMTTTTNKYGNPYNNKKKNIIVSADGGSGDYRGAIIKKLKADGWNVKDLGTGPGTHSTSYNILNKKYSVNLTIYNGVDPKTIDEPVTGWLKGRHEKYGVQLVMMFDTRSWTQKTGKYNKKGLWYKRHGDFKGYRVPKAWDDNYSGARSGVLIEDLHKWYLKYYPRAIYCCGVTPSEAFKQFKAGGYLKMKGYVK